MDILCLMGLFPKEYEEKILTDSLFGVQNAANKLQWAIVRGLDEVNDKPVTICNSLYIGSYPKRYRSRIIPSFPFSHAPGANDVNVGFNNTAGIKILSRYIGVWKYLKKWVNDGSGDTKCVIAYAMTLPFVRLLSDAKCKFKNLKVCLVVPDLPEYMNVSAMQTNITYRFLKNIEIKYLKHCLTKVNNYVFLTEEMKNWFDRKVDYVVVEGICSSTDTEGAEKKSLFVDEKKHLVYTGGIKKEYGVLNLVSSFKMIDTDDWVLDLFGDGAHLGEAVNLAGNDARIVFHGSVSNSVAVQAQREADLLINPRPNFEFAKYSFPSKIMEYMVSGNPMLAYKLDGVPQEYDEFYFHIMDTDGGMEAALREAMSKTAEELSIFGQRAQTFVLNEKNPRKQCERIISLFRD